jgi:Big-like domain-containing protein/WD40 repeat protein
VRSPAPWVWPRRCAPLTGRVLTVTSGAVDRNIGWSADGTTIGFRRELFTYRVPATGGEPRRDAAGLAPGTTAIAWAPDLKGFAAVIGDRLVLSGLELPPAVTGAPAWAPDNSAIAFAGPNGLSTIPAALGPVTPVTGGPAGPPRWSPDSRSLLYSTGGELRTIAAAGEEPRTVLAAERVGAADWQPCTAGFTASCESVSPPRCDATAGTATTQADQPVDLPPPPCTDPAGRALTLVVVKGPDHGALSGLRYTPAPGYMGQDTVSLRVNNGVSDSETFRITVFIVPRPAPVPTSKPPVLVQSAPFLSARVTPRLDRKRRTLVKLSCDQDCSLTVRLTARLRSKRTLNGPQLHRTVAAQRVLSLRLRLPSKPRGTIKTVWITGRVRNAAGDIRSVKVPVRLPR